MKHVNPRHHRIEPWRPYRAFGAVLATYSTLPFIIYLGTGGLKAAVITLAMIRAACWCFEYKAKLS